MNDPTLAVLGWVTGLLCVLAFSMAFSLPLGIVYGIDSPLLLLPAGLWAATYITLVRVREFY